MSSQSAGSLAAPLDINQTARLERAVAGLDAMQLQWLSGYAAGLAANGRSAPASDPSNSLSILFGSQTGNGEALARQLSEQAQDQGYGVNFVSLAEYKPSKLKRESLVVFILSTHGEGDPPDDAELLRDYLLANNAPDLQGLKYSVLALGDSSYVNFCETGREFDLRLTELGAERFAPLVECDLDYESAASAWSGDVLTALPNLLEADFATPRLRAVETVARFDKRNPFRAEILVNQKITGVGSSKDVRHIELSLEGSGLHYEPGDSLAVFAENPPELVEQFIDELDLDADMTVTVSNEVVSLESALRRELEITALNVGFLRSWALASDAPELRALLKEENQDALSIFIDEHQIIDVVRQYPANLDAEGFTSSLRKLSPRSYSIASSISANPDEVHIAVAAVRYDAFGSEHWGAASTHLADRLAVGETLDVYVEKNSRFRLPQDDDTPIIMIGPGTGVAPFRAFVEERVERDAQGPNWLFFGDRTFSNDFLYQLEWQRNHKQGHLENLDVAFSRDQNEKVYVQDRLLQRGREVHAWIERGAHIYVCGDAKKMAGDVHAALIDLIAEHGSVDRAVAEVRLKELRRAGRYQRDVY